MGYGGVEKTNGGCKKLRRSVPGVDCYITMDCRETWSENSHFRLLSQRSRFLIKAAQAVGQIGDDIISVLKSDGKPYAARIDATLQLLFNWDCRMCHRTRMLDKGAD